MESSLRRREPSREFKVKLKKVSRSKNKTQRSGVKSGHRK